MNNKKKLALRNKIVLKYLFRIKNALQYSMEVAANAMEHRAELNHLN